MKSEAESTSFSPGFIRFFALCGQTSLSLTDRWATGLYRARVLRACLMPSLTPTSAGKALRAAAASFSL